MSPTGLHPGAAAVKSRPTRSDVVLCSPRTLVVRRGRGWQATKPSSGISSRNQLQADPFAAADQLLAQPAVSSWSDHVLRADERYLAVDDVPVGYQGCAGDGLLGLRPGRCWRPESACWLWQSLIVSMYRPSSRAGFGVPDGRAAIAARDCCPTRSAE